MMLPTLICNNCGADNQSQAVYCRSCGLSLQAVKPTIYHSATGRLLAKSLLKQRYRIILPIGTGGMGAVYQAEDTQLGDRQVALKEMSQSRLSPQEQKEAADAFRQEAIILARLQHPNLPSIFDHFEENGRWYLIMSFIEGETLADYLSHAQGGKLPLDEALQIGIQLCTVLGYLHNRQPAIIFRDLKPANIMRVSDGHIYLIDFGIARHFKPGQAKDTAYYGSIGYAPPEQYGKAQTTPRSDIYSLGVVLYQLLSGHDPSTTPFRFPPLQSLVPTIPMELAMLITHMLELDENRRPPSVPIIGQKLQSLAASPSGTLLAPPTALPATPLLLPTIAVGTPPIPPTMLSPTNKGIIRRRMLISLAGTIGATIAGSGVWWAFSVHPLYIYHGHSNWVFAVAWSPDGRRIASGSWDNTVQVWDAANGGNVYTYRGHSDAVHGIAWSPDGKRIASASADKTVQVWNVANGGNAHIYREHSDYVYSITWSPDGTRIASGSSDKTVQVWNASDGGNIYIYHGHSNVFEGVTTVTWSPNGKHIASGDSDHAVQVWNVADGSLIYTYKGNPPIGFGGGSIMAVTWSPDSMHLASAGADSTAQVWNAADGTPIYTYQGHNSFYFGHFTSNKTVSSVTWSPDSKRLASGSYDNTVQIWEIP